MRPLDTRVGQRFSRSWRSLHFRPAFGGRDGFDNRRAEAQIALIDELEPDVFLMLQKGFEAGAMRYCTRSRRGSEYAGSLPCPGKARREGRSAT